MSTAAATLPIHPTRIHPRKGLPLQAVGFRKTGAPIWPILGAAEGDDDWATVFEGKTPDQVKTELDEAVAKAAEKGDGDSPWAELFKDQKPEDVKKAVDESRKWETRAKGNKDAVDKLAELAKLITGKDDETDPEKLKGDLTAAQREARATKVENAVLKGATKHGANPDLLVDSRSFMTSVADLDPAADDFATKVSDAIKKAVEDNEALKVVTTDGRPKPVRQQAKPSDGKQGGVQAGAERYRERRQRSSTSTTS